MNCEPRKTTRAPHAREKEGSQREAFSAEKDGNSKSNYEGTWVSKRLNFKLPRQSDAASRSGKILRIDSMVPYKERYGNGPNWVSSTHSVFSPFGR